MIAYIFPGVCVCVRGESSWVCLVLLNVFAVLFFSSIFLFLFLPFFVECYDVAAGYIQRVTGSNAIQELLLLLHAHLQQIFRVIKSRPWNVKTARIKAVANQRPNAPVLSPDQCDMSGPLVGCKRTHV